MILFFVHMFMKSYGCFFSKCDRTQGIPSISSVFPPRHIWVIVTSAGVSCTVVANFVFFCPQSCLNLHLHLPSHPKHMLLAHVLLHNRICASGTQCDINYARIKYWRIINNWFLLLSLPLTDLDSGFHKIKPRNFPSPYPSIGSPQCNSLRNQFMKYLDLRKYLRKCCHTMQCLTFLTSKAPQLVQLNISMGKRKALHFVTIMQ